MSAWYPSDAQEGTDDAICPSFEGGGRFDGALARRAAGLAASADVGIAQLPTLIHKQIAAARPMGRLFLVTSLSVALHLLHRLQEILLDHHLHIRATSESRQLGGSFEDGARGRIAEALHSLGDRRHAHVLVDRHGLLLVGHEVAQTLRGGLWDREDAAE